jgi:dTDP-4-amino-4,6-dideoxygalactose transaminase
MFGNPSDLKKTALICKENNLLLFEDCAHGIGSYCGEKHVGTEGNGALFSFGIYKIINSFGGGMLVQRNSQTSNISHIDPGQALSGVKSFLDSFIRFAISTLMTPTLHTVILYPLLKLSKQYLPQLYHTIEPSKSDPAYLFEIDNRAPFKPFMVKMIKHQLLMLHENITRRKKIAEKIKSELKDIEGINVLNENKFGRSNYSYFGIYVPNPEAMAKHLEVNRVIANPHEYYDCSNLPQFSDYKSNCTHASYAEKHLLRLPNYPCLQDDEVDRIVTSIRSFK